MWKKNPNKRKHQLESVFIENIKIEKHLFSSYFKPTFDKKERKKYEKKEVRSAAT